MSFALLGAAANSYAWTPTLPAAGRFEAFVKFTSTAERASDASYRVYHDAGFTDVTINQTSGGGVWISLGSYDLTPGQGNRVEVNDVADGTVVADAVRFVPESAPPGELVWILSDHLGTPQKMVDGAKTVIWDRQQTLFGITHSETASPTRETNVRFPGQYADGETGLSYNYFRDYDPTLGRYIQSDPIGLAGGINIYAYAYQNPLLYQDRDGRVPLLLVIPVLGGTVNGIFSAVNASNDCNADFYSVALAFGIGFASGFTGTAVGLGVGLVSKNPALAGNAGGLAGNLVEQALGGERFDGVSAIQSVVVGAVAGSVASRLIPTRGFLPSLTRWRSQSNLGLNSQRLLGQEAVSGSAGGAVGSIQDYATDSSCECQQ